MGQTRSDQTIELHSRHCINLCISSWTSGELDY